MDSLPWGTGNSLKASPAVQRKGEQRSSSQPQGWGRGEGTAAFHTVHAKGLESLRDRTVGLSLALGTLILLHFCPFLPGSSFPLISGAVSILSSLCRALISSPQHWTLEKAPSQLRKHTLTCCPEVKSLVSLIYDSYRELLMQVHNWNSLGFAAKWMTRRWR